MTLLRKSSMLQPFGFGTTYAVLVLVGFSCPSPEVKTAPVLQQLSAQWPIF
jgi:hypothetical protein